MACCNVSRVSERGNHEQFEALALPLLDALYNFAMWLTADRAAADDLVQETWVKALKGFGSFAPGTNFRAWLFRILRNTFLSARQRSGREVPLEEGEEGAAIAADPSTPESLLLAASSAEELQRALEDLPVIFRETLLLAEVEEMSYQEIAETVGVPIGTVMSRLARARRAMRSRLAQWRKGAAG